MPAVVALALGALGAVVLVKLFNREWQRVNDELDRANPVRVSDPERAGVPTLRRDPTTGEYRAERLSVSFALLDALLADHLAPALVFRLEELAELAPACPPPGSRRNRSASASPPDR